VKTASSSKVTTRAEVLEFIRDHAKANRGRVPTLRAIADGMGLHKNTVAYHVEVLVSAGLLDVLPFGHSPAYVLAPTDGCCSTCGRPA
jgi:predicted ArsR family transcriptional regulator